MLGTCSDDADGFHASIGEGSIAGKLGETLYCISEGVDGGREVLPEDLVCSGYVYVCMCVCVYVRMCV